MTVDLSALPTVQSVVKEYAASSFTLPTFSRTRGCVNSLHCLALSYVYSKQPIFGLTQEWLRELSFSRLECGVHDKLHISSADWWDRLLPLA